METTNVDTTSKKSVRSEGNGMTTQMRVCISVVR